MYTIKHAAQVTGLSPATLRAWEHRYGIVTPHRTESGYRLYDEPAVRTLTLMATLVEQGWSPQQAAEETRRRVSESVDATPAGETAGVASTSRDVEAFVDAAARLDLATLTATLDAHFGVASFESVVDGWLMPGLVALGEAWADGRVSVAGEHLASAAVMRRLAASYEAASAGTSGPAVLVGLPPGSRHELGVLAFATAARRAGLRAAYVGADLPTADWVAAVATHNASAVVLAALQEQDLPALGDVVAGLRPAHPGLVIAVGGAEQEQAPPGCLRLGHDIGPGAALLAAQLGVVATP